MGRRTGCSTYTGSSSAGLGRPGNLAHAQRRLSQYDSNGGTLASSFSCRGRRDCGVATVCRAMKLGIVDATDGQAGRRETRGEGKCEVRKTRISHSRHCTFYIPVRCQRPRLVQLIDLLLYSAYRVFSQLALSNVSLGVMSTNEAIDQSATPASSTCWKRPDATRH